MNLDLLRERVTAAPTPSGDALADWHAELASANVALVTASDGTWDSAASAVSSEVDAGVGALMLIDDTAPDAQARAIAALYCGQDATSVIPDTLPDLDWMLLCAEVRDAMPELRRRVSDPLTLLDASPMLRWHASAILHAVARRTPVLLAGAVPVIAGLCAQRAVPLSSGWVHIGLASTDPAARAAESRLGRPVWFTTSLHFSTDTTLRVLRAAAERNDD